MALKMMCPRCWRKRRDPVIPGPCSYCQGEGEVPDEQLSPHFLLSEFLSSDRAIRFSIPNDPDSIQRANIRRLVTEWLEPARVLVGVPIEITSGYRSARLNKAVGSRSPTSAHRFGWAADMKPSCSFPTWRDALVSVGIPFEEVLLEWGWVHAALFDAKGRQKREVLRLDPAGGPSTLWR